MRFNQRASVVTLDGKGVGHVDRVVIDPTTKEITHLVIQRGLLQKEDLVVPIEAITADRDGELTLHRQSSELQFLPAFEDERYVRVDENQDEDIPPTAALSPTYPGSVPGFVDYGPRYAAETHLNIPKNTVALKEGARVITHDNKHVGHVMQVLTNHSPDEVSYFLIVKGLMVKEQRLVPMSWVDRLADNEVQLEVDAEAVERLPVTATV